MRSIITFIKKESVFSIACLLAFASMFFVTPSMDYMEYIDFRTLSLLLALMLVVQGLKSSGLFTSLVDILTCRIRNTRQLAAILILLCFFSSMLITNDVALITFVPFSILFMEIIDDPRYSIKVVVFETIAANLGSMLTPIGNPQNLYLYSISEMKLTHFIWVMLPYSCVALVLLFLCLLFIRPKNLNEEAAKIDEAATGGVSPKVLIYGILFIICILTVVRLLDFRIMLAIVITVVLFTDYRLIFKADYILLLTFTAFFIFIGNIKNLEQVSTLLESIVRGREISVSIAASQVVSNVPAAMLLSGFTDCYDKLIIGINLGGLGTLIASMASLISFKFYGKMKASNSKAYIAAFTIYSILFLIVLLLINIIMQAL